MTVTVFGKVIQLSKQGINVKARSLKCNGAGLPVWGM
jgi:hypothetical protein